jgi:ribulose-5-phosphate 4-epimerase/fuculose-1-phosphate aldolase
MTESALREEICRIGQSLYARGYVHATAGNISVRLSDGFLITPTDACLGTLDPATLAKLGPDGAQISGLPASKTQVLHRAIYTANTDANAVLHTHSSHLVALTLAGVWSVDDVLPPITPYFVMKVGHVPLIPYHRPGVESHTTSRKRNLGGASRDSENLVALGQMRGAPRCRRACRNRKSVWGEVVDTKWPKKKATRWVAF